MQLYIVYLQRGAFLVHSKVWICENCKNLLLHHFWSTSITYGPPNTIRAFIHLKSLKPFCFPPNMQKLQGFNLFFLKSFMVGVPCHHGPIWWYYKNLVHHHLQDQILHHVGPTHHSWSILCNIHMNIVSYIFIKKYVEGFIKQSLGGTSYTMHTSTCHIMTLEGT
jgi:hypothetical protein